MSAKQYCVKATVNGIVKECKNPTLTRPHARYCKYHYDHPNMTKLCPTCDAEGMEKWISGQTCREHRPQCTGHSRKGIPIKVKKKPPTAKERLAAERAEVARVREEYKNRYLKP